MSDHGPRDFGTMLPPPPPPPRPPMMAAVRPCFAVIAVLAVAVVRIPGESINCFISIFHRDSSVFETRDVIIFAFLFEKYVSAPRTRAKNADARIVVTTTREKIRRSYVRRDRFRFYRCRKRYGLDSN